MKRCFQGFRRFPAVVRRVCRSSLRHDALHAHACPELIDCQRSSTAQKSRPAFVGGESLNLTVISPPSPSTLCNELSTALENFENKSQGKCWAPLLHLVLVLVGDLIAVGVLVDPVVRAKEQFPPTPRPIAAYRNIYIYIYIHVHTHICLEL